MIAVFALYRAVQNARGGCCWQERISSLFIQNSPLTKSTPGSRSCVFITIIDITVNFVIFDTVVNSFVIVNRNTPEIWEKITSNTPYFKVIFFFRFLRFPFQEESILDRTKSAYKVCSGVASLSGLRNSLSNSGSLGWECLRENIKKTFSFGHCSNHLNPPPLTPSRATLKVTWGEGREIY